MMKKHVGVLLAALVITGSSQAGELTEVYAQKGGEIIKAFSEDLKNVLMKGMKEQGPVETITACNGAAPGLAETHSKASGWQVGRTSLKVRNPKNAPDAWETAVLKEFETRKAAGEDPMKLAKSEVVEENGHKVFRMMKAIPMADACTKCHGETLEKPVAAKVDEHYPKDQARGFKAGDLRGAFTLKKPL